MSDTNSNISRNGERDTNSPRAESKRALRTLFWMMAAGLVSVLIYAVQAGFPAGFLMVASVGLLLAGASALAGGLLGFLFGIPRTLQQESQADREQEEKEDAAGPSASKVDYKVNTNLEQISDWLTKILVGVGLTQIVSIRDGLVTLSSTIGTGLGGQASNQVFVLSLLCFFLVLGFLFGYLWTRLFFTGALREADEATLNALGREVRQTRRQVDEIQRQAEQDAHALALAYRQLNPRPDSEEITQEELDKAVAVASKSVKIQLFNQAWSVRSENWRNNKPKMELTIPIFEALIRSDHEGLYHMNHGQLGFALKDKTVPDWEAAKDALDIAIERRDRSSDRGWLWYEWNRAECKIKLDKDFEAGKKSSAPAKESILRDISSAARARELRDAIKREFTPWMTLNDIAMDDVATYRD